MAQVDDVSVYELIEGVEPLEKYEPGGFHPVQLRDVLAGGQYTIVHKLGYGGFSTIWLARDKQVGRYVAIKICVASSDPDLGVQGLQVLDRIRSQADDHPGKKFLHLPFDSFTVEGPNGSHRCLVSAVGRCSAAVSKSESEGIWLFPLETARAMTAQLILALSFLHSLDIVHGDLHMGNILFAFPDISSLSVEDLYAKYGPPHKEAPVRIDGKLLPSNIAPYIVRPAGLAKVCEEISISDAHILVTDFGESWLASSPEPRYDMGIPVLYRAPEAMFAEREGRPLSFPVDIWALACVIYGIFAKGTLFEGLNPDADTIFAENISALGKPPARWWDSWQAKSEFFADDGSWRPVKIGKSVHNISYTPLEARMEWLAEDREGDDMTAKEIADLHELLAQMLRWLPEDRPTAEALAKGEWMQKWGLPALAALEKAEASTGIVDTTADVDLTASGTP